MTKRKIASWVMPPEQDAEGVAGREDVLATSAAAYDPKPPVLCMDAQPVQLRKDTRGLIAAMTKPGTRVDDAYERHGTASMFMCAEPLSGVWQATARARRTQADWAIEVAQRLETRYTNGAHVTRGCANLNTHTKGAFYEAFAPERAHVHKTHQLLFHPETRELAPCRRMCTALLHEPVSERSPHRRTARTVHCNCRLVGQDAQQTTRRRLAISPRKRPRETATTLPQN